MKKGRFDRELTFSYNPLLSFASFASAHLLLSYFSLTLEVKLWVALLGFGLPVLFFLLDSKKKTGVEVSPGEKEFFPRLPIWVFVLLVLAALAPRLYQLTSLSVWPFTDEGYSSFESIRLSQSWNWRFFFLWSQNPPLFNWLLALYFKCFTPSLQSLWFFSALISLLTVGMSALAAGSYFSRSFTLFYIVLMGFSFWPLYAGRICQPVNMVLFLQFSALALLAFCLRRRDRKGIWKYTLLLGLVTGLGFYGALVWPVVAVSIGMIFLHSSWFSEGQRKAAYCFWSGFLAASVSYFLIYLFKRNGQYFQAIWAFRPGMDLGRQAIDFFSHFQALFWGYEPRRLYGPVWGGLLNPVLGSLVFVGVLELLRLKGSAFRLWVLLSAALFIIPIVVARGYDSFRIFHLVPILFLLAVAGLQAILAPWTKTKKILAAFLILGSSAGLDAYHLFGRFHQAWGTPGSAWNFGKEYQLWKSYEILRQSGPGALLFDLGPVYDDVSSCVADYSFDTASNPSLSFEDSKWVAVLVDANEKPFLSKRLPEGRYYWLCPREPYGNWMLGVIPVSPKNKPELKKWFDFNREMKSATDLVLALAPGVPQDAILDRISNASDKAKGDRFLESCLWEKTFHFCALNGDSSGCLKAARQCVSQGYPLPEMFNEMGVIMAREGRYREAREAFQKALKQDQMHFTPAAENLQVLERARKP